MYIVEDATHVVPNDVAECSKTAVLAVEQDINHDTAYRPPGGLRLEEDGTAAVSDRRLLFFQKSMASTTSSPLSSS